MAVELLNKVTAQICYIFEYHALSTITLWNIDYADYQYIFIYICIQGMFVPLHKFSVYLYLPNRK